MQPVLWEVEVFRDAKTARLPEKSAGALHVPAREADNRSNGQEVSAIHKPEKGIF